MPTSSYSSRSWWAPFARQTVMTINAMWQESHYPIFPSSHTQFIVLLHRDLLQLGSCKWQKTDWRKIIINNQHDRHTEELLKTGQQQDHFHVSFILCWDPTIHRSILRQLHDRCPYLSERVFVRQRVNFIENFLVNWSAGSLLVYTKASCSCCSSYSRLNSSCSKISLYKSFNISYHFLLTRQ